MSPRGERQARMEARGAPAALSTRRLQARAVLASPLTWVLLLAAFFDGLSDNWIHAALLSAVGLAVARDAALTARGVEAPVPRALFGSRPGPAWILMLAAAVLVALALWELAALLSQPDLQTGSTEHPTVSVLMDPVLSSHVGRSITLCCWLLVGWYLLGRAPGGSRRRDKP